MAKAKYMNKAKVKDFQICVDQIRPFVYRGDFDSSFELLDEFRIGPNTLNPRGRNFAFWLIEEQSPEEEDLTTQEERRLFFEFTKLFIDKGVEIDHQDKYGVTLLNWATYTYCSELCLFLLTRGASPNIVDCNRLTPLDYATYERYEWGEASLAVAMGQVLIPALLRAGADPYLPYPSLKECKKNVNLSWNLNEEENGIEYNNLMERVVDYSHCQEMDEDFRTNMKLFLDVYREINGQNGVVSQ